MWFPFKKLMLKSKTKNKGISNNEGFIPISLDVIWKLSLLSLLNVRLHFIPLSMLKNQGTIKMKGAKTFPLLLSLL